MLYKQEILIILQVFRNFKINKLPHLFQLQNKNYHQHPDIKNGSNIQLKN